MRQHGVTNYPDPQGADQNQILITKDIVQNPNYDSASKACASLRPENSSSDGSSNNGDALLALAKCMRSHGVKNFPDPTNGKMMITPESGLDPSSPTFKKAMQTCQQQSGIGSLKGAPAGGQ